MLPNAPVSSDLAPYLALVSKWLIRMSVVVMGALAVVLGLAVKLATDDEAIVNRELAGIEVFAAWFPAARAQQSWLLCDALATRADYRDFCKGMALRHRVRADQLQDKVQRFGPVIDAVDLTRDVLATPKSASVPTAQSLNSLPMTSPVAVDLAERSHLILDSELRSYHLMDAYVLKLPELADHLALVQARTLGTTSALPSAKTSGDPRELLGVRRVLTDLRNSVSRAYANSAVSATAVDQEIDRLQSHVESLIESTASQPQGHAIAKTLEAGDLVELALTALEVQLSAALRDTLNERRTDLSQKKWGVVLIALLAVLTTIAALLNIRMSMSKHLFEMKSVDSYLRLASKAFESSEPMVILDKSGVIQQVNQAFIGKTGFTEVDVVGLKPSQMERCSSFSARFSELWTHLKMTGVLEREFQIKTAQGETLDVVLHASAVRDRNDAIHSYIGRLTDVTERNRVNEAMYKMAYNDALTGLPNRRRFIEELGNLLQNLREHRQFKAAILFLDLDGFKVVNDVAGHRVGDDLLRQVGTRLRQVSEESHLVARLGGDEFCLLLADLKDAFTATALATNTAMNCIRAVAEPLVIEGVSHRVTVSVGVSLVTSGDSVVEAMKRADFAMYEAKAAGKNTYRFFDGQSQAGMVAKATLTSDLRQAVFDEQFRLHYQRQVSANGRWVGVEALVRWQHPSRGLLSPVHFIPLAEENGLILKIGRWVLVTACNQLAEWSKHPGTEHLTISINVSVKELMQPDYVERVLEVLHFTEVRPLRLKLELTETMFADNLVDIIGKMQTLRAHGIRLSIDDFGTGYSSLSYLKKLPVDEVKVDKSFMAGALTDPRDAAVVKAVIEVAHSLGLLVVAEGVETPEQNEFLVANNCNCMQGYLFGRPEVFTQVTQQ